MAEMFVTLRATVSARRALMADGPLLTDVQRARIGYEYVMRGWLTEAEADENTPGWREHSP